MNKILLISAALALFSPFSSYAAGGRSDYDLDDDGLIEINDLADLNEIRNNLDGTSLYGESTGCDNANGCFGFELTTDLDFDTNADGMMDASDTYWNDGSGWQPVGTGGNRFNATFDGNGHRIQNLYIDRSSSYYVGLFGYASSANIRNLGLTGSLMQVRGRSNVGSLAGYTTGSSITGSYATGSVTASADYAGGLVGYLYSGSSVENSYATGPVTGTRYTGGLVGRSYGTSTAQNVITNSFATGYVQGNSSLGGLIGYRDETTVTGSYWATDSSGQSVSDGSPASAGVTLAQLQCPTGADNADCATGVTLYAGWADATYTNQGGNTVAYWDFGTNGQLPGLNLNGVVYRDSDGDGSLDVDDAFVDNRAASWDMDHDGHPDTWTVGCDDECIAASGLTLDQVPTSGAAWQDADLDGQPDSWADGCDSACQAGSGLVLDAYPDDTDNDGLSNAVDTDDNNDGVTDADADSDGLIDISTLEQLNAMRFNLAGTGRTLTAGGVTDSSGCPSRLVDGVEQNLCIGYELTADLNFDTNADGMMDASDTYWNDGSGWEPVGSGSEPFTATFGGNGHRIQNLYINRSSYYVGLFGYASGASIRNLGLTGNLMQIRGFSNVGGLAGYAKDSLVTGSYATGSVTASGDYAGGLVGYLSSGSVSASYATGSVTATTNNAGGLVGYLSSGSVSNSYATGVVTGIGNVGGLVGWSYGTSTTQNVITNSFATGSVQGNSSLGGLIGYRYETGVSSSYWATDSSGQLRLDNYSAPSYVTLAQLQCPTGADNADCATGVTLYAGWADATYTNQAGNTVAYWDFGTNGQLPGLNLNGVVYRDSDGDGSLDVDDAFVDNRAASWDIDHDGHPDAWTVGCDDECIAASGQTLDQFPTTGAAWQDADLDGQPDSWADGCDSACQAGSGLILDAYPDDTDNDGMSNAVDTDDNNDGVTDADADSDGLIDISTLEQLNAMRFNLAGTGRTLTAGGVTDSSGCPSRIVDGVAQPLCYGYELTADLNFDTNADGVMDASDTYWNDGSGWQPVGTYNMPFAATFDGNGHRIQNLYINRSSYYVGLFGYASGASIRNLGLTGNLMQIRGSSYVGGLVGTAKESQVTGSYATGSVTASGDYAGGLVGYLYSGSSVENSYATGVVTGMGNVGGLVGWSYGTSTAQNVITNSFATGYVQGNSSLGGLIGYRDETTVTGSYWATDSSGQSVSDGSPASAGVTLAQLQCPTGADNADCVSGVTLYAGWADATYTNQAGNTVAYWDFGTNGQLPGLSLNSVVYRDSDGDGSLDDADTDDDNDGVPDATDAFPHDASESVDSDGDGIGDNSDIYPYDYDNDGVPDAADAFPHDASESLDSDGDGVGDNSDAYPYDYDNDGVQDAVDAFPYDASESVDSDGDGVGDNADSYPHDTDNDGVDDSEDPDNSADNGLPVMQFVPDDIRLSANNDDGSLALMPEADYQDLLTQVSAFDAVEAASQLHYTAYLNGVALALNNDGVVAIPVGPQTVVWKATDSSGNESLAGMTQHMDVYPQVRFRDAESVTGENSTAGIIVELSGPSPQYPVAVTLAVDTVNSTLSQADVDAAVNLSAPLLLNIEAGENQDNTTAVLSVPVVSGDAVEADEQLLLQVSAVTVAEGETNYYTVDSNRSQHTLTVTQENLAPVVSLSLAQGGKAVDTISLKGGEVTLTATISDPNGDDTHTLTWEVAALGSVATTGLSEVRFAPDQLAAGTYSVKVTVEDSGMPALSADATLDIVIPQAPDSGSGGGALIWLLGLAPLLQQRSRRQKKAA